MAKSQFLMKEKRPIASSERKGSYNLRDVFAKKK